MSGPTAATLRAVNADARYPALCGREIDYDVVVRSAAVELTMALLTPAGRTGTTFHRAARDLMERTVPAWRHAASARSGR